MLVPQITEHIVDVGNVMQAPFGLKKSLCYLTQGEVGCLFCICCRDPGDCLSLVPVWFGRSGLWKGVWLGMGGDGFQTQKKRSWVSGQVRAERVLADAITIDGRKERTCKFFGDECVEAVALQALWQQHPFGSARQGEQAMYAKSREWYSGPSSPSGGEE